jgi:plastocyanin
MTKSNKRRWPWLPGLILVLALTACGSGSGSSASSASPTAAASASQTASQGASQTAGPGASSTDTIIIKNFMFSPASLTVSPGAVVTVRNEDSVTHTVTDKADPKLFSTGNVAPGTTSTFTAPEKPGSYPVFCMIHQYMTGTLVVR